MKLYKTLDALWQDYPLKDGVSLSFHHHLRNGDNVINTVLNSVHAQDVKALKLFPSAIFPSYESILTLLEAGKVDKITTNYLNGAVADYLSSHTLKEGLVMQTHGGRARAIIEGESIIDMAFIAAPLVDEMGNAVGHLGPNACGSLGYACEDAHHAKVTILVADTMVQSLKNPQIHAADVDGILLLDSIGDAKGIVSGTTSITHDPIGVKIARTASQLIEGLDIIKEGFSFQSGAGGISLRVTESIHKLCKDKQIKASFFSGGITAYHVKMLEEGLVQTLYDVQCFDLEAIKSLARNENHKAISASLYANPNNKDRIIKDLDVVILGATEIDLDFNVNVTTDSYNRIMGGSGGHADTAEDAKVTIIVSPLIKGRTPIIKDRVNTITTNGKHIDCFVTERGISVNPLREDIMALLKAKNIPFMPIETLQKRAHDLTGIPHTHTHKKAVLGIVESRHGNKTDTLYTKE